MITFEQAMNHVASWGRLATVERRPLSDCYGLPLAAPLEAPFPSPAFTNSAMDGFAYRAAEMVAGSRPVLTETIFARAQTAQDAGSKERPFGAAQRIMTGAPLPSWADTVIPVELTELTGDGGVVFKEALPSGANVRHRASDLCEGSLLFSPGTVMTPERILVAANFGFASLDVLRPPVIGVFSTGDELVELGEALAPGAIFNSTKYFLAAALAEAGLKPEALQTLGDEPDEAERMLGRFFANTRGPCVVLTTGAVSAGDKDFIPELAQAMGFETAFHKIAIRPGKPVFLARRGEQIWIGLPGNPVSTAVVWRFFVRPALAQWFGIPGGIRRTVTLANDVSKRENLRHFVRAMIMPDGEATVPRAQGSAELAANLTTNGYVVLPEGLSLVPAGTKVEALLTAT